MVFPPKNPEQNNQKNNQQDKMQQNKQTNSLAWNPLNILEMGVNAVWALLC